MKKVHVRLRKTRKDEKEPEISTIIMQTAILKKAESKKCMGGSSRISEYTPPTKQEKSIRTGRMRDDEKTDVDSRRKNRTAFHF